MATQNKTYLRNGTTSRVTVSSESDGEVKFAPKGGGFLMSMPSQKFYEQHSLETQAPKLVPAYFGGDWSDVVTPGYNTEGARWNGWGMPLFAKAAAIAVASEIDDLRYNPESDSFDITIDGELEQFEGGDVDVPGVGRVRVYAIGSGSWCWDHYESLAAVGDVPIADVKPVELTDWINEDHCSFRCIADSDPSIIANRVAFIEKTPRVRTSPFTEIGDCNNWLEGPKGSAPDYGRYAPSRQWCDERLLSMGYVLRESQDDPIEDRERPRG